MYKSVWEEFDICGEGRVILISLITPRIGMSIAMVNLSMLRQILKVLVPVVFT